MCAEDKHARLRSGLQCVHSTPKSQALKVPLQERQEVSDRRRWAVVCEAGRLRCELGMGCAEVRPSFQSLS